MTLADNNVSVSVKFHIIMEFTDFFCQNYDTSESKLRREFEVYGSVKKVSHHNYNIY